MVLHLAHKKNSSLPSLFPSITFPGDTSKWAHQIERIKTILNSPPPPPPTRKQPSITFSSDITYNMTASKVPVNVCKTCKIVMEVGMNEQSTSTNANAHHATFILNTPSITPTFFFHTIYPFLSLKRAMKRQHVAHAKAGTPGSQTHTCSTS